MNINPSPIILRCFCTDKPSSGNLAGVVLGFQGTEHEKLVVASQLNLPVTVFLTDISNSALIEFYYPQRKMPLCLHGALAAGKVMLDYQGRNNIDFVTCEGETLSVQKNRQHCFQIKVLAKETPVLEVNHHEVANMLHIEVSSIQPNLPLMVASVGSPKLLIPVVSDTVLETLNPNYDTIKKWCITNNVNGFYVYNRHTDEYVFRARGFNPNTGHNEDSATGVAAAALALALNNDVMVYQGQNIDMSCVISVTFKTRNCIWVGGNVRF